jgi:hypothetical protein
MEHGIEKAYAGEVSVFRNRLFNLITRMNYRFEQEIKTRIVHKAKSVRDEPVFLKNNLKHFALQNSLAISQQNFERAMERIGVNTEQTIVSRNTFIRKSKFMFLF